jgi:DnaJ-class molecular chaperone
MKSKGRKTTHRGARGQTTEVTCAFCGGKGLDPFGIMSPLAECQVCDGAGHVELTEPTAGCAFCRGSGIYPNSRLTCISCDGVGMVEIPADAIACPHCGGSGRTADCKDCPFPDSVFPCQHCKGTGYMPSSLT